MTKLATIKFFFILYFLKSTISHIFISKNSIQNINMYTQEFQLHRMNMTFLRITRWLCLPLLKIHSKEFLFYIQDHLHLIDTVHYTISDRNLFHTVQRGYHFSSAKAPHRYYDYLWPLHNWIQWCKTRLRQPI